MPTSVQKVPEGRHPSIMRRVAAGVVLLVAAVLAVTLVVHLISAIVSVVVFVAVVVAVLWALKTIFW